MYSIEEFKNINKPENIVITQHSRIRFAERGISILDVCGAIDSGEIIEQYPDDFPFPSCLIMGNADDKIIHLVASINEDMMYVITAYIPNPEKWEDGFKVRKENSK